MGCSGGVSDGGGKFCLIKDGGASMKPYWLEWFKAAGIRAVKTFAQSMLGGIAIGAALLEIQWSYVLSVAVVAAILSMLTSVAGLPEVEVEDDK